MKKKKRKIIIICVIAVCLLAFYKIFKDYTKQNIIVNSKEVSAGSNCAKTMTTCPSGYSRWNQWVCMTSKPNGKTYDECKSSGGTWYYNACYTTKSVQTICTACKDGYDLIGGGCYNCSITGSVGQKRVSRETSYNVSYTLTGCSSTTASVSASNGNVTSNSSGRATVYTKECGISYVTISKDNKSIVVGSVEVVGKWVSSSAYKYQPTCTSAACADSAGINEYYTNPDEDGYYRVRHFRDCSGGGGGSSAPYACYADASVLSLATSAKWIRSNQVDSVHRIKVVNVKKESDCKVQAIPSYCNPANTTCAKTDVSANSCEDSSVIKYKDGKSCSGTAFYNIDCDNVVTTKFDYGDDNTGIINTIYAGQGFKYGITITSEKTCKATFNKTNWTNAYNIISNKIKQANNDLKSVSGKNKTAVESEIKRLQQKQNELKEIVNSYNSYNPVTSSNEGATISLVYKVNKKTTETTANLQKTIISEGTGKRTNNSQVDLGITKVYNYTWTNKNNPRKVKLILPRTYINQNTGAVDKNGVDGGNKLYTDYKTDPNTYNMNIKVSGVGCNGSVSNDKCNVIVKEQDILYRPIDVSNPFINNKWTPGSNWINNQFDFRSVIHDDVWLDDECYSKYTNGTWKNCNQE